MFGGNDLLLAASIDLSCFDFGHTKRELASAKLVVIGRRQFFLVLQLQFFPSTPSRRVL
jgi:hypothetical protein